MSTPQTLAEGLAGLLSELAWRDILHASTPGLQERLATGRLIAAYIGFDPTASSLHVGHLIPIFGLIRLQRRGGRPVALVGGGTGLIGDPSFRSADRPMLSLDDARANADAIHVQLERFLDFTPGSIGAVMANNLDWLGKMSMIEYLRDIGKHFTVPYMLAKDSVQVRLEKGLSFTEFSYMTLQAIDFQHLYRNYGVEMQMGGADQWGNITAGLELIRRSAAAAGEGEAVAHGISYKLLLAPSGAKFGKSEAGESVWLDAARTTPFAFYQYWLNADDRDVATYMRWFTLWGQDEVAALDAAIAERPGEREAQRRLAYDVTARVHSAAAAQDAVEISAALFQRDPVGDPRLLARIHAATSGPVVGADVVEGGVALLLAEAGLAPSRGEARRLITGGGITVNGERTSDPAAVPTAVAGKWIEVRVGKRNRSVVRVIAG